MIEIYEWVERVKLNTNGHPTAVITWPAEQDKPEMFKQVRGLFKGIKEHHNFEPRIFINGRSVFAFTDPEHTLSYDEQLQPLIYEIEK